ncbi:MAG: hypothetical protein M3Z84_03800, partial [Actinomycetota bacterium]|nr:hypothetical protein [Actinomycetota bacterium]
MARRLRHAAKAAPSRSAPPWPAPSADGADDAGSGVTRQAVVGRARVDMRTKRLLTRLQPGEIAVVDHEDLDRLAAEGLIRARVGAIVNASRSISGRYPNMGPLLIAAAGIPLVDEVGIDVMNNVA